MASVSGILMRNVVPMPTRLCTSIVPPIFSMFVFTTSMPTPRPETFVTAAAVEKPGRKIRLVTSRAPIRATCSAVSRPFSTALAPMTAGSMPLPSSVISMLTWPPSWKARSSSRPSAGLPAATRTSGVSMAWSTALRTRWVSGSLVASRMVRSSSVSLPSISTRTFLPQVRDRSRTTRGTFCQMLSMGCMRVFMTPSCSSLAMRFSRCEERTRSVSSRVLACCTIWLRVSTSSPTRFMSASSRSTSTRMLLSATERRGSACSSSACSTSAGATAPCCTRISPSLRSSPRRCSTTAATTSSCWRRPARRGPRRAWGPAAGSAGDGRLAVTAVAVAPSAGAVSRAIRPTWSGSPSVAGRLDAAEQPADGVDHLEQRAGDLRRERELAVAQPRQQVLADVGDRLEPVVGQEAAGALDRVDRAEHAAEQVPAGGVLLERDQVVVQLVEVLVALDEELLDDLVHLVHSGVPLGASAVRHRPGQGRRVARSIGGRPAGR